MNYSAAWIAEAIGGTLHGENVVITGSVETDSRACTPGSLYVARLGETTDGHRFIDAAIENGAVCSIVTDCSHGNPAHPKILVADATLALGKLAKAHIARLRELGEIQVIGITGSVGKTTTKDLTANILKTVAPTVAAIASFNNEVGMPLTALAATEETRFLVLEMGASGPGHLAYLTDLVKPDIVVELAVGQAHLGGFGSIESLAAAKAELVAGVIPHGTVILNADDELVLQMKEQTDARVITFSATGKPNAGVRAEEITLDESSCAGFKIRTETETAQINLGLVGIHQVNNALAAATIALTCGLSLTEIAKALNGLKASSPHRMNVFKNAGITFIDDSYNANPDSMRAGLKVLTELGEHAPRRIAVLGEMMELGDTSDQLHQEIGYAVEAAQVDLLVTLGEGAKEIAVPLQGKIECHHAVSAEDAFKLLKEKISSGDVVFLKGSNGSGVWKIADSFAQG
ncbi:UDP-N-acetylmuramoyl-tripeptide--D-alanyl-D-alanine ligase [Gleimia sp. 6138-11-ORH1]|uniref:UDP-N-acetylmuramoyl-tripeptide--D-alanyl-D- alanine ligase n=1 Tax=Gleimia sp. 6138-11-ORH1 TaxID=2973937 RepID=UPI00216A00BE|nr:UDP-N-acetylmuramoyl-tripeptide--D-alanyl-D-alanine ligase [Gleimia sp. 6138-11-ORH1]MCS4484543.1 UDP-N-acetylmuramoyl-tripeptide--D-alanyl-D-alanine ligase [Gleimia sp. 6138-11-ORH1]